MRGKEEKKRRGKEEKKRRKGGKNWGPNRKKKKKSVRIFSSAQSWRHFLDQSEIRYLEKSTLYNVSSFEFMQDFLDEQIM